MSEFATIPFTGPQLYLQYNLASALLSRTQRVKPMTSTGRWVLFPRSGSPSRADCVYLVCVCSAWLISAPSSPLKPPHLRKTQFKQTSTPPQAQVLRRADFRVQREVWEQSLGTLKRRGSRDCREVDAWAVRHSPDPGLPSQWGAEALLLPKFRLLSTYSNHVF